MTFEDDLKRLKKRTVRKPAGVHRVIRSIMGAIEWVMVCFIIAWMMVCFIVMGLMMIPILVVLVLLLLMEQ